MGGDDSRVTAVSAPHGGSLVLRELSCFIPVAMLPKLTGHVMVPLTK